MGSSKQLGLAGLVTYLAMLTPLSGLARGDEIRWLTNYAAALKEAGDKNRPVLLDVYKVPCPPCKYLDNVVYRDPAVVKFINDNFIALKINGEVESVRLKEGDAPIALFPTLLYLTAEGNVMETQVGLLDAPALLEQARKALTTMAALPPKQRPGTPFQAGVWTGTGTAQPNVWATNQYFPPSSLTFSLQPLNPREERKQRARELLGRAVDSYRKQQWLACLDLSRSLIVYYPDLAESSEARQLEQAIGPERFERLEKELMENLGQVYWEIALVRIRQNQTAQAVAYMEKIVQTCPGTRFVPAALEFLRSLSRAPGEQQVLHSRP